MAGFELLPCVLAFDNRSRITPVRANMIHFFKSKMPAPDAQKGAPPPTAARLAEIAIWLAIALVWTGAWCWVSVLIAGLFAPVLVFPLLTGLVLGAGCAVAMRLAGLGSRRWLLAGTLALSLALAAGQHYIWYRITEAQIEQGYSSKLSGNKLSGLSAAIPDLHPSFDAFLQATAARGRAWFGLRLHGGWVWASWALDAALESAAAVGLIWLVSRQPYCSRCRSWYRPVRRGKLNAKQAVELSRLCGCQGSSLSGQYRLLHCQSGCGPARLELVGATAQAGCEAWLDESARRRVLELLDQEADSPTTTSSTPIRADADTPTHPTSTAEEQA